MSVAPLTALVRGLRGAAAAEDELLEAALQALPESELRRLCIFAWEAMQTLHYGYQSDDSTDLDLPSGACASGPAALGAAGFMDLLDLGGISLLHLSLRFLLLMLFRIQYLLLPLFPLRLILPRTGVYLVLGAGSLRPC